MPSASDGDERDAFHLELLVLDELHERVEVGLGQVGDQVRRDHDVELGVAHGSLFRFESMRRVLAADPAGGVCLCGVLVQGVFVFVVEMGGDIEGDVLDRAGECERGLVSVTSVHDQAVVSADVHAGVAAEDERHGVIEPAAADGLAVDLQRDLAGGGGLGLVRGEDHLDGHVARR